MTVIADRVVDRVPLPQDVRVLIVDPDRGEAASIAETLAPEGYRSEIATTVGEGLKRVEEDGADLLITDLSFDDGSGLRILDAARARVPPVQTVVVATHSTIESAVEAMNRGALTYLSKPVNPGELRAVVRKAFERLLLERTNLDLQRQLETRYGFEAIIGASPKMQRVFDVVRQVAPTSATVLILGETGTGKELIAKTIHQNSPRRNYPLVGLNCSALSESILESELFGHEKGAFTGATQMRKGRFEYAHKGTLFLDEVGDMPIPTQIKLLRVLEEREIVRVGSNVPIKVDVRLIAATNQDLEELVKQGRFRQDLYFRLKVVTIRLPPLRERTSDIPLLAEHFINDLAAQHGKRIDGLTPESRRILSAYRWPGNVRELRNCIETMIVVSRGSLLDVDDIPESIRNAPPEPQTFEALAGLSLEDVERELIRHTLAVTEGNREAAARMLGIGERTLYRKIKKYDLR